MLYSLVTESVDIEKKVVQLNRVCLTSRENSLLDNNSTRSN